MTNGEPALASIPVSRSASPPRFSRAGSAAYTARADLPFRSARRPIRRHRSHERIRRSSPRPMPRERRRVHDDGPHEERDRPLARHSHRSRQSCAAGRRRLDRSIHHRHPGMRSVSDTSPECRSGSDRDGEEKGDDPVRTSTANPVPSIDARVRITRSSLVVLHLAAPPSIRARRPIVGSLATSGGSKGRSRACPRSRTGPSQGDDLALNAEDRTPGFRSYDVRGDGRTRNQ